jgi:hypothetical protein
MSVLVDPRGAFQFCIYLRGGSVAVAGRLAIEVLGKDALGQAGHHSKIRFLHSFEHKHSVKLSKARGGCC